MTCYAYAIGPGSIANKGIAIKEFVAPGPDGSKIGTQGMFCSRGCPSDVLLDVLRPENG